MKIFVNLALVCAISLLFGLFNHSYATCIGKQECYRTAAQTGKTCPDPAVVTVPTNTTYEPSLITTPSLLETPCPFIDASVPLCCSDDNAIVMGKWQKIASMTNLLCQLITLMHWMLCSSMPALSARPTSRLCGANMLATLTKRISVS